MASPAWERQFRRVWAAVAFSNLGDGLLVVILPLVAVQYTRSPVLIGGIAFAASAPYLLISLFAGALADRWDRRRLMIGTNLIAAATLFSLAVVIGAEVFALPLLYVAAFALGTCETLFKTSSNGLVPNVVPRDRLDWAYTRLYGTESALNEFVGPPLAGLLVTVGAALAFGTIASAYGGVLVLVWGLRGSFRTSRPVATTMRSDIGEGLRFVWNHPVLRILSLMVAVMAACWSAWSTVLVLYVVQPGQVGLSSVGYGILLTTLAAGGLLGTLIAGPLAHRFGRRPVIMSDVFTMIIMLAVPALTANPYAIGAAMMIGGAGSGMWNVVSATLRQAVTPDQLRGRVGAAGLLVGWGPIPFGALLGGILAELAGVRVVFAVGACLVALLIVPALRALSRELLAAAVPPPSADPRHSENDDQQQELGPGQPPLASRT